MTSKEEANSIDSAPTFVKREKIVNTRHVDGVTYTLEWTRCGHAERCGRCRVAYYGHGPYWYARYWDATAGKRGRTITKYIGRQLRYLSSSERPDHAPRGRPQEWKVKGEYSGQ